MTQWLDGMHVYVLAEDVEGALEELWEHADETDINEKSQMIGFSIPDLAAKQAGMTVTSGMHVYKVRVDCNEADKDTLLGQKRRIEEDWRREREAKEAAETGRVSSLHQLLAGGGTKATNPVEIDPIDLQISAFTRLEDGSVRITGTISAAEAKKKGL